MNMTFNDTYEIQSVIGRGGMSTVYLAEHKRLHNRWAVKEVRKQQGVRFDFLAESNILKRKSIRKVSYVYASPMMLSMSPRITLRIVDLPAFSAFHSA